MRILDISGKYVMFYDLRFKIIQTKKFLHKSPRRFNAPEFNVKKI